MVSEAGRKRSWRDRKLHGGEIGRAPAWPWTQTRPWSGHKGEMFHRQPCCYCVCVYWMKVAIKKVSPSVMWFRWTSLFVFIVRWSLLGSSIGFWPTLRVEESTIPRTSFLGSVQTWNLLGRRMTVVFREHYQLFIQHQYHSGSLINGSHHQCDVFSASAGAPRWRSGGVSRSETGTNATVRLTISTSGKVLVSLNQVSRSILLFFFFLSIL